MLEAKARFEGEERPVFVRIAEHNSKVYLDLADDAWRVVEIDACGWGVRARSPVMFERSKGLQPLPCPSMVGSVAALRPFVNVNEVDWQLLLAFLVVCLYPNGPFPILILVAEQGSGKTTLARIIKRLVDANLAPVRSAPRDERDLMIAAQHSWLLVFDNLSGISANLSDALCRLSTGGGFSTRELFSDSEETTFDAQRPVVITAIDDVATRSDLLDRALIINLRRIEKTQRKTEGQLYRDLESALPSILGALLTAVSVGLERLPHTTIEAAPRMADFATWATACEEGLGLNPGSILDAYRANRSGTNDLVLEVSPVSTPLKALLEAQQPDLEGVHRWEGSATELLADLEGHTDERTRKLKTWPSSPRALSGDLRRIAPNLRDAGIELEFTTAKRKRLVTLTLRTEAQTTVSTVATVAEEQEEPQGRQPKGDAKSNGRETVDARPLTPLHPPSLKKERQERYGDGGNGDDAKIGLILNGWGVGTDDAPRHPRASRRARPDAQLETVA